MFDIDKIKALPIRDVIEKTTGLKFNRNGNLEQCPFCGSGTHGNGTSAFHIKESENYFKCFSCDAAGNPIDFVMKLKDCDFVKACEILSDTFGIERIEDNREPGRELSPFEKKIYAIKKNPKIPARNYLRDARKLDPAKLPPNSYYYDTYSEAVVFIDSRNQLINKRFINPEQGKPKAIFEKGSVTKNAIYISAYRREHDTVYITEGVINALSLYVEGYSALAIFSTSNKFDDVDYLKKFLKNKNIVIAFDPDDAGDKAMRYYKDFIQKNIPVKTLRALLLPPPKDLNDLLKKGKLRKAIQNTDNYNYIIYPLLEIPLRANVNDIIEFESDHRFYFRNSRYYEIIHRNARDIDIDISDCIWRYLYRIIDSNGDATHLIKVQHLDTDGKVKIRMIEASTDDIQKERFEKKLNNIGFSYYGGTRTYNHIKLYNLHREKEVLKIEKYGYHPEYNLFFWTNLAISPEGKILKPNEIGIIEHDGRAFYLETQSPANIGKRNFAELKKFNFKQGTLPAGRFMKLMYKAYKIKAFAGITYLVGSLFRDIIFDEIGRFPNLYLYGPAGTGKSAFIELLLAAQGDNTGGYSLQDTSQSAFSRVVDARINSLIYLKEYSEKLPSFVDEFLKTAYEGQGRTIGVKTTGNEVISYQALTGLAIDANFLPVKQEAVFSRMIILDFRQNNYTTEQGKAYERLQDEKKKGLSQVAVDILKHRDDFKKSFPDLYTKFFKALKNEIIANERLLIHAALLFSIFKFLSEYYEIQQYADEFRQYIYDIVNVHNERLTSFSHSRIFWEAFAVGLKNNQIKDIENVMQKVSYIAYYRVKEKEGIIALKSSDFKVFAQIYAKYCKDVNITPLKPNMLKEELVNANYFIQSNQKSRNTTRTHTDSKLGTALYFQADKVNPDSLLIDGVEIELST